MNVMGEAGAGDHRASAAIAGPARALAALVLFLGPLLWCAGLALRTLAVSSAGFTAEETARYAAEPFGQYLGMPLLAAALYRARIFGGVRTVIMLWSATMWAGILKTAGWWDVVAVAALFAVLAGLALHLARAGEPKPRRGRGLLSW